MRTDLVVDCWSVRRVSGVHRESSRVIQLTTDGDGVAARVRSDDFLELDYEKRARGVSKRWSFQPVDYRTHCWPQLA